MLYFELSFGIFIKNWNSQQKLSGIIMEKFLVSVNKQRDILFIKNLKK